MHTKENASTRAIAHYIQALVAIIGLMAIDGSSYAQSPAGTVSNIPFPDNSANAFSTSLRYDAGGNLYAWDGLSVWERAGAGRFRQ